MVKREVVEEVKEDYKEINVMKNQKKRKKVIMAEERGRKPKGEEEEEMRMIRGKRKNIT